MLKLKLTKEVMNNWIHQKWSQSVKHDNHLKYWILIGPNVDLFKSFTSKLWNYSSSTIPQITWTWPSKVLIEVNFLIGHPSVKTSLPIDLSKIYLSSVRIAFSRTIITNFLLIKTLRSQEARIFSIVEPLSSFFSWF